MVREIRKDLAKNYLIKAEEFYTSALENFQKRRFNATCFDASQGIIMANDSFCIAVLGKRASKDHREAIALHLEAARSIADTSKKEIISIGLDYRSEFGYTEKKAREEDAHKILVRSKRFIDWVKEKTKL